MEIDNTRILITGATSGIGRGYSIHCAKYASKLILVGRRENLLAQIKEECIKINKSIEVLTYSVDLSENENRNNFLQKIKNEEIDILINNAGLGDLGKFSDASWDKTSSLIDVNIKCLTHLSLFFAKKMKDSMAKKAIINVSSLASFVPAPKMSVYSASKAYVTNLTESLAIEFQKTKLHFLAVCPGPVSDTEFSKVATREGQKRKTPRLSKILKQPQEKVVESTFKALKAEKRRISPGIPVFIMTTFLEVMPMFLLRPFFKLVDPASVENKS